jgi:SAM-dependent methyltransferase/ribosomal protein S18 acetylase RimI-like enzyme
MTPSPILRALRDDEVDAAYEIQLQACAWLRQKGVRQWLSPKPRAVYDARQQKGENHGLYIAGSLAATLALSFESHQYWREEMGEEPRWWLHTLVVAPGFRGRRVGEEAVSAAVALIRSRGAGDLFLDCSTDGVLPAYYGRLGFETLAQKNITYPSGNTYPITLMRRITDPSLASRLPTALTAKKLGLDPLVRFSDRVGDYVKYRPSYPAEVIRLLEEKTGLAAGTVVADVGAGTGIFTRILLGTGAKVFAVEPNDAMRAAAEAEFRGAPSFSAVAGTAEATGLGDRSVGLITCAQAFHWFDPARARQEFRRILKPGGWCALVWNTPIENDSDFSIGFRKIKDELDTDFQRVRLLNMERTGGFERFFGAGNWEKQTFKNSQTLDLQGLKGRMLSSSYAPKPGHPRHPAMIAALEDLFRSHSRDGAVQLNYETEIFYGRLA